MARASEKLITIPVRLRPELVAKLNQWAKEGRWRTRGAMLSSIIEDVITESNSHEELIT